MRRRQHLLIIAAALSAAVLLSPPSASQSSSAAASSERAVAAPQLQRDVDKLAATIRRYGGAVGVSIIDVETGQVLAGHEAEAPLNPASNMKVLTAAAALWKLGGAHRYQTGLYGKRNGAAVEGLVLRSYGDPSLETQDLWQLADRLYRDGVRKVSGGIQVDQSFFDDKFVPPGFDQQPEEWAYFRAPVSAIALNRNTITLSVVPSVQDGRAIVDFDPPGFVDVTGQVGTGEAASAQSIRLRLLPNGARLTAQLGGSIPVKSRRMAFTRRVDDPTLMAGHALQALLVQRGIAVDGPVRAGGDKQKRALVVHSSEPLSQLIHQMGKSSDNFYAEMVFKSLAGLSKRRGLSSQQGAAVIHEYLAAIGSHHEGNVIVNGSGLFDTNRITPSTLTDTLRAAYLDPRTRPEFVAHLAVAGVDGTLRHRLRKTRGVRAKTGTLSSVTSLSGYVLAPDHGSPVAFSIVINRVPGKVTGARNAMDSCVEAIGRWMKQRER